MVAATKASFAEFDALAPAVTPFEPNDLPIWHEHKPVAELFTYAVFRYNDYSGQVIDVDWSAVDVLLMRCNINPEPRVFADWRIALRGYIEAINEQRIA